MSNLFPSYILKIMTAEIFIRAHTIEKTNPESKQKFVFFFTLISVICKV